MTTTEIPVPSETGYQASPGEGITEVTLSVRPSLDYQTVEATASYAFPSPRSYTEAIQPIEELYQFLLDTAKEKVADLAAKRNDRESAATAQVKQALQSVQETNIPDPTPAPAPISDQGGEATFAWGENPQGKAVKYVPSTVLSSRDFEAAIKQGIANLGLPSDQVMVFDNRVGKFGFETGNNNWGVANVIAKRDSRLLTAAGGDEKAKIVYVDFNDDGTVRVKLSKQGEQAKAALALATELGGEEVPF